MAELNYGLAIDQGTTGSTVLIVSYEKDSIRIVSKATVSFPQHYPQHGWVEHDLEEIWSSIQKACQLALAEAQTKESSFLPHKLQTIGITNQRETLCIFDRMTGKPLRKAIVWQCKRSSLICDRIKKDRLHEEINHRTGLVCDPYFTGTKLTWVLENESDIAKKLKTGEAIFGTIDTYLVHRLTNGKVYATEPSNASRTLLYNIHENHWDPKLLEIFDVKKGVLLPEVKGSASGFGKTFGIKFLPDEIPISGILGDQQAALAGQGCFKAGQAKCTYGTGAFMLFNTGAQAIRSQHHLLTTIAWSLKGATTYALEGSAFIAGASIQFLRDNLELLATSAESEILAQGVRAAPEVYFVPSLSGLGTPWWVPEATGAFLGLTRGTTKGQLIRACLEGISLQVNDIITSMASDCHKEFHSLKVDGGATSNDLLLQIQANLSGVTVERPKNLETTAFGAALFAGIGVGLYPNLEAISHINKLDKRVEPDTSADALILRKKQLDGWNRAVQAVKHFALG